MSADVAVQYARRVIGRPHEHSDQELRYACAALISRGDWMDVSRATELRHALDAEAARFQRSRRRGRIMHRAIIVLLILNLVLFATTAGLRHWSDSRIYEGGPGHAAQR